VPFLDRQFGILPEFGVARPKSGFTQDALNFNIRCTLPGGTGNLVSMAEAKGCISAGHCGSYSHSAVPHFLQKLRWPLLVCSARPRLRSGREHADKLAAWTFKLLLSA